MRSAAAMSGTAGPMKNYIATAPDQTFATPAVTAAPGAAAAPAPAYGAVQAVPQYFYHAQGTMSAQ